MMSGLFLEDLYLGQKFTTDPVTISESEIIAFAEKYDPQPFHIDKDSAEKSVYGGLIASGFQTIAIAAGIGSLHIPVLRARGSSERRNARAVCAKDRLLIRDP